MQKQRLDAATEDIEKTLEQMGEIIKALNTMSKSFKDIDTKEALKIYEKLANKSEDEIAKATINLNLARSDKEKASITPSENTTNKGCITLDEL